MKKKIIIPVMLMILVFLVILATAVGTVYVPFIQVVKIILKNLGIIDFQTWQEPIIMTIRLPRVIVAVLVGGALATSGAVMQGMFRNPMADPGIIGVSSGASLGAVITIALGLAASSLYFMPLLAVAGALSAVFIIYILSTRGGKIPALTLILAGIAVSTFIGAITSMVLSSLYDYQVKEFVFWTMGSLSNRGWQHVGIAVLPIIVGIGILITYSRDLNIMLLGEEEAQSVGLNPSKTRRILLILVSITTASAVCVSGTISFVGLIVPHIIRLIVGPDHRILLPASAVGGAIFLVGCDLIARVVVIPSEIGVGIVTSLLGAPYFLYLLVKAKREGGVF